MRNAAHTMPEINHADTTRIAVADALAAARRHAAEEAAAVAICAERWPGSLDHRFACAELARYQAQVAMLEARLTCVKDAVAPRSEDR